MALAKMISVDRDALICDMAETYHIYDLRGLPGRMLAVLAFGLRADSRIMQRLNKQEFATETMLLATIADRLGLLVWHQTRDGQRGVNRPQSIRKHKEDGHLIPFPRRKTNIVIEAEIR